MPTGSYVGTCLNCHKAMHRAIRADGIGYIHMCQKTFEGYVDTLDGLGLLKSGGEINEGAVKRLKGGDTSELLTLLNRRHDKAVEELEQRLQN